jgi:uncharacterized protein with von Willebrand factor type A (vWA) domain
VAAGVQHGESDPRMPGPQHGGEALPSFRLEGRSSTLVDGEPRRATQEVPSAAGEEDRRSPDRERRGVLAAYSPDEVLDEPDALGYAAEEIAAMRRLGDDLRAAMPQRPSRRLRPARRAGHLDMRRTVRRSLGTDGETLRPAWTARSRTPRRLLLLCDVSGSMERYSRALLAALEGAVRSGLKVEAFVFATRLTRLTATLGGRDAAAALEQARVAVTDWSSGTRIGPSLAEFNAIYARRGFARGAFVIVVSDGWDRGDPELLAREAERLRLGCRRLIWINPRPVEAHGQPLAVGMRAALPFVDDYVAGPHAEAIFQLGRLLKVLGPARPARSQRPVRLAPR